MPAGARPCSQAAFLRQEELPQPGAALSLSAIRRVEVRRPRSLPRPGISLASSYCRTGPRLIATVAKGFSAPLLSCQRVTRACGAADRASPTTAAGSHFRTSFIDATADDVHAASRAAT